MPGVLRGLPLKMRLVPPIRATEKEDQVAEKVVREQEYGPGFRAGERGITIPQHGRAHLAHQQIGEQRSRQQDGEEVHQADEEFLGVEVHREVSPLNSLPRGAVS